jgi:hypothetical protein
MIHSIDPGTPNGYRRAVRRLTLTVSLALAACGGAPAPAPSPAAAPAAVDARAASLLDALLDALARGDTAAAVPLLHRTLLSADGAALDPQVEHYAWRKAAANAHLYARPPVVTSVRDDDESVEAGERGHRMRYFLEKKPELEAMPAPVTLFWPADGGAPKVLYFGGL